MYVSKMELCDDIIKIIASKCPKEFLLVNKQYSVYARDYLLFVYPFGKIVESDNPILIEAAIQCYLKHRENTHLLAKDEYKIGSGLTKRILYFPVSPIGLIFNSNIIKILRKSLSVLYIYRQYIKDSYLREDNSRVIIKYKSHILQYIISYPNELMKVVDNSNIQDICDLCVFDDTYTEFLEYCLKNVPEIYSCRVITCSASQFDLLDKYGYDFSQCSIYMEYIYSSPTFEDNVDLLLRLLKWKRNGVKWMPSSNANPSNLLLYVISSIRPEITRNYFQGQ